MLYKQQLRCSICMLALFKQFSIQGRRSFTGQFWVECHVILHDAIAKCWHWDCCTRVITSSHISECSITKWLRSGRHQEIGSTVDYAVTRSRTWIAVDPVGIIFRDVNIGLFKDRRCFGFSKFFMIFSIFFLGMVGTLTISPRFRGHFVSFQGQYRVISGAIFSTK